MTRWQRMTPTQRAAHAAACRAWRQQMRRLALCTRCGANLPPPGRVLCAPCLVDVRAASRRRLAS